VNSPILLTLPEYLVEHFNITKVEELNSCLDIYFEEKNDCGNQLADRQLILKGFYLMAIIEDFSVRVKSVKLHIQRRRWADKQTGEIIARDWNVIVEGIQMIQEFSSFLKKLAYTKMLSYKAVGDDGKKFQRQYKNKISDFKTWSQCERAKDWLLYPKNIAEKLSIDEVCLSKGELLSYLLLKLVKTRKTLLLLL